MGVYSPKKGLKKDKNQAPATTVPEPKKAAKKASKQTKKHKVSPKDFMAGFMGAVNEIVHNDAVREATDEANDDDADNQELWQEATVRWSLSAFLPWRREGSTKPTRVPEVASRATSLKMSRTSARGYAWGIPVSGMPA